jgi:hypothetical protein
MENISKEELIWWQLCGGSNWASDVQHLKNKLKLKCPGCGGSGYWVEKYMDIVDIVQEMFQCTNCMKCTDKPIKMKRAPKESKVEQNVNVSETAGCQTDENEDLLIEFCDIRKKKW